MKQTQMHLFGKAGNGRLRNVGKGEEVAPDEM